MKTRFRFKHRLDKLDADGDIVEHLAGIEESQLASASILLRVAGALWVPRMPSRPPPTLRHRRRARSGTRLHGLRITERVGAAVVLLSQLQKLTTDIRVNPLDGFVDDFCGFRRDWKSKSTSFSITEGVVEMIGRKPSHELRETGVSGCEREASSCIPEGQFYVVADAVAKCSL
jgi:hypothetical protein